MEKKLQKYKNTAIYGIKEQVFLTTRCIMFKNGVFRINKNRFIEEIKFYRHLEKEEYSYVSLFTPILLFDDALSVARNSSYIFSLLKNEKPDVKIFFAMYLLSVYLSNETWTVEDIYDFTVGGDDKQIKIQAERIKIDAITTKKDKKEYILDLLSETSEQKDKDSILLDMINSNKSLNNDIQIDKMSAYYAKLLSGNIFIRPFEGKFDFEKIYGYKTDMHGKDDLIGDFKVLDKNDYSITLETKRGVIKLNK